MYQIVKARYFAKNPSAGPHSLLESFTCLLHIANTDDSDYVWQVINECDLDFNLAAEMLLSKPHPIQSSRIDSSTSTFSSPHQSLSRPVALIDPIARPTRADSPVIFSGRVSPASSLISTEPSQSASTGSPPCSRLSPLNVSSAKRPCNEIQSTAILSRVSSAASSSTVQADAIFDCNTAAKSDSSVAANAESLLRNFAFTIRSESVSGLQNLAFMEFNLLCDTVSTAQGNVVNLIHKLNELGAFANLHEFALSGELWSFIPMLSFDFVGYPFLPSIFRSTKIALASGRRAVTISHYLKLNSSGLSLKVVYKNFQSKEAFKSVEMFLPFSCFSFLPSQSSALKLQIHSPHEIRSDIAAFGSLYDLSGAAKDSLSISVVNLYFDQHVYAQTIQDDINALISCRSPHALDLIRICRPAPAFRVLLKHQKCHLFSDPWHLARVLFDEKLLTEACLAHDIQVPPMASLFTADTKFVLKFKIPSFLLPMFMRAKHRMQLISWSRFRPCVNKLVDLFIPHSSMAETFPFLNSGLNPEDWLPYTSFFEFAELYISNLSVISLHESEMTVVFYHQNHLPIPASMLNHLMFSLKDRDSAQSISHFRNHLILEGRRIMNLSQSPVASGIPPSTSAKTRPSSESTSQSTANSTSEWMNFLALTDADVPENLAPIPSFFLQSLLPSQRQSMSYMIEIEKRTSSAHLFRELQIDDCLATTEFRAKHVKPVEHARFYSLCSVNGPNRINFCNSPPNVKGGLLCDPMGSGKTRTCIALIASTLASSRDRRLALSKDACNLILVPPNVLGHWIHELESCFGIHDLEKRSVHIGPDISVAVVHGTQNHDFHSIAFDIILTTYQTFSSRSNQVFSFNSRNRKPSIPVNYCRVFCDEAHILRHRSRHGVCSATYDSIWLVTGTPIVLHAEDLNSLLEYFKLRMPKQTFGSLLTTNQNIFGEERQIALAILKPIFVYHSPHAVIGGVPVTCGVGSDIVTVRIFAGPLEFQVYESFREALTRSRGIQAVLTKIIEGLRRSCSPRSFDPAAYLHVVSNLLNQVEIRLRDDPEFVPRIVEAKFIEKTLAQALEFVTTPFAKSRIRELWEYLSNSEEKDPYECTVCMEVMKDPLITSCGHWFCGECVTGVLDSQLFMCPICRTRTTNKTLMKLVGWQAQVPSAIRLESSHGEGASIASPVLCADTPLQAVDADTPSKLIYLRRKFLSWVNTDDKIVIFSDFQGCLQAVVELARSVGINAAVCFCMCELSGSPSVFSFKCQVLNHSLTVKQRSSRISEFQDSANPLKLLAVSVATCGVGMPLVIVSNIAYFPQESLSLLPLKSYLLSLL
jgi:hypothetical protein